MSFGVEIFDPDSGNLLIIDGVDSGNYPIDQRRQIDLSKIGIAEGTFVKPQVRPVWGSINLGDRFVQFAKNNQTAVYDVTGTTLNSSVHLISGS